MFCFHGILLGELVSSYIFVGFVTSIPLQLWLCVAFYGSQLLLFYIFIVWLKEHMLNIDIPPPKDVFHFHFLTIICHVPLFFFSKNMFRVVKFLFSLYFLFMHDTLKKMPL
jgi:hypothetical protein